MEEIENKDILNFYKDENIDYSDKLLFKTAKNNFNKGYDDAIDKVLEIIKKNPLFPPTFSQKLFLKIKQLKK